jgi:hypothetical protein
LSQVKLSLQGLPTIRVERIDKAQGQLAGEFDVFMLIIFVFIGLFHLLARQGKSKGARLGLAGLDPTLS